MGKTTRRTSRKGTAFRNVSPQKAAKMAKEPTLRGKPKTRKQQRALRARANAGKRK